MIPSFHICAEGQGDESKDALKDSHRKIEIKHCVSEDSGLDCCFCALFPDDEDELKGAWQNWDNGITCKKCGGSGSGGHATDVFSFRLTLTKYGRVFPSSKKDAHVINTLFAQSIECIRRLSR